MGIKNKDNVTDLTIMLSIHGKLSLKNQSVLLVLSKLVKT